MLFKKLDSIKNSLIKVDNKDNKENKKNIENLVFIAVLLVIVIISINFIWKDDKKKSNPNNTNTLGTVLAKNNSIDNVEGFDDNLEKRLEDILSKINGVGDVKVLITYAQTSKVNPVYNENYDESVTEEEDTSGGKRTVSSSSNQKEVVSSDNNEIVTMSITSPQIQGAVVIAKGAGNSSVKSNIIQAVEAATGLSTYKIQVFEMN